MHFTPIETLLQKITCQKTCDFGHFLNMPKSKIFLLAFSIQSSSQCLFQNIVYRRINLKHCCKRLKNDRKVESDGSQEERSGEGNSVVAEITLTRLALGHNGLGTLSYLGASVSSKLQATADGHWFINSATYNKWMNISQMPAKNTIQKLQTLQLENCNKNYFNSFSQVKTNLAENEKMKRLITKTLTTKFGVANEINCFGSK